MVWLPKCEYRYTWKSWLACLSVTAHPEEVIHMFNCPCSRRGTNELSLCRTSLKSAIFNVSCWEQRLWGAAPSEVDMLGRPVLQEGDLSELNYPKMSLKAPPASWIAQLRSFDRSTARSIKWIKSKRNEDLWRGDAAETCCQHRIPLVLLCCTTKRGAMNNSGSPRWLAHLQPLLPRADSMHSPAVFLNRLCVCLFFCF